MRNTPQDRIVKVRDFFMSTIIKHFLNLKIFILIFIIIPNSRAQSQSLKNHSSTTNRIIDFAGCKWVVKSGYWGPGPNYFSDSEESVWLDNKGRLHMKVRKIGDNWYCPEVYTQRYTGYGEHRFLIEYDVTNMDQNVVLGLFVYANDASEIDIEFSKWGDPNFNKIGSFTIQPYTVSGNMVRFEANTDSIRTTHFFNWQENYILFGSIEGHHEGPYPAPDYFIHRWIYWGDDNPGSSHNLRTHINFWLFQGKSPVDTSNLEVIITKVNQPLSVNIKTDGPKNKVPNEFKLNQNYPNPFHRKTTIQYQLKESDWITIDIFNLLGKKVETPVNSYQSADRHTFTYDAEKLPPGVYFYRLKGNGFSQTRKMILMR